MKEVKIAMFVYVQLDEGDSEEYNSNNVKEKFPQIFQNLDDCTVYEVEVQEV